MDIKAGQKVWLRTGSRGNSFQGEKECTVEKVGKLYFYLEGNNRQRFRIKDGAVDSEFSNVGKVYASLEEILHEKEHTQLSAELKKEFSYYSKSSLSLNQLRAIKEIIYPTKTPSPETNNIQLANNHAAEVVNQK